MQKIYGHMRGICMHDADNEIVNSQANMTKANQYSLWHEVYETTGYDARNATYRNGTFIAEDTHLTISL